MNDDILTDQQSINLLQRVNYNQSYAKCLHQFTITGRTSYISIQFLICDGGKGFCLDDLKFPNDCIIYSFGIGGDTSFDESAANLGQACSIGNYNHILFCLGCHVSMDTMIKIHPQTNQMGM